MADENNSTREVDNPAEVLRNENGIFEVMSPYGYLFQVTCRPGRRMDIRNIGEPASTTQVVKQARWRIRRISQAVA
jgi:hypothetical protein